ncbi:uroporphyrinogen-III synthase-like, partial [Chrysoperla carnea]|uniref:uroporphyrinogen-III synthase-like n=1 Tax=Chrysoperla carnea TaxID=189513 RepID=UPI001D07B70C
MKVICKEILILKSQDDSVENDNYVEYLTKNNLIVKFLKVLVFVYKNLDILSEKLTKSDDYHGVIFTSPRAIFACHEAIQNESLMSKWKDKQNYVIGEKSQSLALNLLGLNCSGQESGNAINLAKIIISDVSGTKQPFLFPCGNIKRDVLKTELQKEDIHLEEVTIYETIKNPDIETEFGKITENFTRIPEVFVYFSPSGVQSTKNIIERLGIQHSLKFIAIGPTTAEEITKIGWELSGFAEKPTPESLLKTI